MIAIFATRFLRVTRTEPVYACQNSATLVHFLTVSLVLLVASARGVGRAGAFRIAERVCTGHIRESRCNK